MTGKPVALGPVRLVLAQPGRSFFKATLHFHHMRHRVHGPGHARVEGQRAAAGFFGLGMQVAFFQAEGVQRQRVGEQRVGFVPGRQRACRAGAQVAGVAAVEVPQLRPLQRQRVARVFDQQFVPDPAGGVPAAFQRQLHGLQMGFFAPRGLAGQGAGV